ncbi:hypothetical protein KCN56_10025 [Photobacterium galatheae]|uniref:hypothetical protein n=1 Tax=Photobacterium galatheae TaxID=1654360 RepID=UPI00202D0B88|nr:hypothetical protein [Photobacterium galatheae]MCM0148900.1 hypothetical protein [Photobacterium galatheae]
MIRLKTDFLGNLKVKIVRLINPQQDLPDPGRYSMTYQHGFPMALFAGFCLMLQSCSSGDDSDEANTATAVSPIEQTRNVYQPARTDKAPSGRSTVFQFTNIAYFREGLKYDNPAQFTIFDDGSWEYYAENILNSKITGGDKSESGGAWTQTLYVKYYSDWDNYKRQCAGTIIHSKNYDLVTAKYNVEIKNYSLKGMDSEFKQKLSDIHCIDAYQQWHQ